MIFQEYLPYYKRNLKLAFPVVLSQAGTVTVHLIDNIMVGHVGTTELAAASFANAIFIVGFVFGIGFIFGLTPLVSQAYGDNNKSEVRKLLNSSFFVNTILSISLTLMLFVVSFFMDKMGQTAEVSAIAMVYYRILVLSLLPFLFFFNIKQFIEGLGNTKTAMYVTIFANIVNVVLNYAMIYGKFGFPEYGVYGAAYSTLISRVIMPIIIVYWFVKAKEYREYIDFRFWRNLDFSVINTLFKTSLPIASQLIVEVLAFVFGGVMMGWLSEEALAAHQIALSLASFTFMICTGIGSATTIRVSYQLGAKNYIEMRKAAFASIHLIIIFMGITGIIFYIFRNELPLIFTKDPKVIIIASKLLIFAAVFQIADGLQMVSIASLRAISDVNYALIMSLLSYGLIFIVIAYIFAFLLGFGESGIWLGFVISLFAAAIIFVKRFDKKSKNYINFGISERKIEMAA